MSDQLVPQAQSEAGKILASGVRNFESGNFDEAARLFEKSAMLGEELAKIYLGNLLGFWFIPGCRDPENVERIERAIATFQSMLLNNRTGQYTEQARKSLKASRYLATSVAGPSV